MGWLTMPELAGLPQVSQQNRAWRDRRKCGKEKIVKSEKKINCPQEFVDCALSSGYLSDVSC